MEESEAIIICCGVSDMLANPVEGAMKCLCARCKEFVWLSPTTPFSARDQLLCTECAQEVFRNSEQSHRVEPLTKAQMEEVAWELGVPDGRVTELDEMFRRRFEGGV